jgi:hypothetical protein
MAIGSGAAAGVIDRTQTIKRKAAANTIPASTNRAGLSSTRFQAQ